MTASTPTTTHRAVSRYQVEAAARPEAQLIRTHARLLERHARLMASRTGIDPEEFWSVGAMALIDAAARYDPAQGASLETFLGHRVRGAMLDEVRRLDRLPRRLRQRVRRVVDAHERLSREGEPSVEDVAEEAGVDADDTTWALQLAAPHVDASAVDLINDEPSLEALLMRTETVDAVAAAIAELPDRLRLIVSLRYVEDLPQKDIARMLDVSEARISQLLRAAVAKLSAALVPHNE
jgi:RNA polymerase sigma factor for flagellar operon FliA